MTQFLIVLASVCGLSQVDVPVRFPAAPQTDSLVERFINPPPAARPWVYWWWMDHVSKESITRDLEALKAQGIGGMVLFQCDGWLLPEEVFGPPQKFWTPEWCEMVRFASEEAKRLGLELTINCVDTSSGCGGPWIPVEESGQTVVWSGIWVEGGQEVVVQLPQPETRENFYRDVAVVAYPSEIAWDAMRLAAPTAKSSSDEFLYANNVEYLFDRDPGSYWSSGTTTPGGEYVDLAFEVPFSASAVTMLPRGGWGPARVDVQVSDDGVAYRSVKLAWTPSGRRVTVSFDAVSSRFYRIAFPESRSGDGRIGIAELRLLTPGEDGVPLAAPFDRFAEQLANAHHTSQGLRAQRRAGDIRDSGAADAAAGDVFDITSHLDEEGVLRWEAPEGNWMVLRFGRTSGKHIRVGGSKGYHVDYLNPSSLEKHFTKGIDPMLQAIGYASGSSLVALHEDSFEMPYNRWTGRFPEEFKARRSYEITPWLPVLAGHVVDSQGASERFLRDYRRTIADLYITHWETARELSAARGFLFEAESAGPQPYCLDALAQLGRTDRIMGEFWSGIYRPGVPADDQNRGCWNSDVCETIRQTASAGHTYGHRIVGAEAFTGYARPFVLDPFDVKAYGDRALCDGLNRFVIHLFMTQPLEEYEAKPVVVRLHAIDYNRRTTWFEKSRFWTDYLARCSAMLQAGRHVADILCFLGEDAPSFVPQREYMQPGVPDGYDYDACNTEVLLTARVQDGRIHLPSGAHYAVLTLPTGLRSMTPEVFGHLRDLVRDGATVLGPKPEYSPSLYDHENADAQVAAMANELWGTSREKEGEHVFGKGRVIWGESVEEALASANCEPACVIKGTDSVLFIQRRTEQGDVFFISVQANAAINFTASFRAPDTVIPELWDPATGKRKEVIVFNQVGKRVEIPLHLDPRGSVFIILRRGTPGNHLLAVTPRDAAADELRIINARYASKENPDKGVDVTRKVAAAVRGNQLEVRVWPDALGVADPAPNEVKALTLDYAVNGNMHSTHATDGKRIIVGADDNEQDYRVVRDEGRLKFISSAPGTYELQYADGCQDTITVSSIPPELDLSSGWGLRFERLGEKLTLDTLISWTELPSQEMRFYSGTVTYRKRFPWSERSGPVELDLGSMKNIAEVTLNGGTLGILWKPPYRIDVTTALKTGDNELEVKVTNLFANRITGDFLSPPEEKQFHAFGAIEQYRPYAKEDGPLPSGLFGPVVLRVAAEVELKQRGEHL